MTALWMGAAGPQSLPKLHGFTLPQKIFLRQVKAFVPETKGGVVQEEFPSRRQVYCGWQFM